VRTRFLEVESQIADLFEEQLVRRVPLPRDVLFKLNRVFDLRRKRHDPDCLSADLEMEPDNCIAPSEGGHGGG